MNVERRICPPHFLTLGFTLFGMIIKFLVFKKMSGNHFDIQGHCDLDLYQSNSKIIRGHLLLMTNSCEIWRLCVIWFSRLSTETIWFTDWPTNQPIHRPTLAKQYTPSSSKGGITITINACTKIPFHIPINMKVQGIWTNYQNIGSKHQTNITIILYQFVSCHIGHSGIKWPYTPGFSNLKIFGKYVFSDEL